MGACAGPLAKAVTCKATVKIPATRTCPRRYWTPRTDASRYDFEPDVPFGVPFRPSPFVATFTLRIGGADVTVDRAVQYRYIELCRRGEALAAERLAGVQRHASIPAIAVFPVRGCRPQDIAVTVGNNQKGPTSATAALQMPAGWKVTPASAPVTLSARRRRGIVSVRARAARRRGAGEGR